MTNPAKIGKGAIAMAALVLAACAPVDEKPDLSAGCPAPRLAYLVGQVESAATGVTHDGAIRIIRPGMAITMDYNPGRLNIEIGEDGRIARVFCG